MKIFFTTFLLAISWTLAYTQNNGNINTLKVEYQLNSTEDEVHVTNCEEYGAMVFYLELSLEDTTLYAADHLDVNLDKVKTYKIAMSGRAQYLASCAADSIVYTAFASFDGEKNVTLVVNKLNLLTGKSTYLSLYNADYKEFKLLENAKDVAYVAYTSANDGDVLSIFDFNDTTSPVENIKYPSDGDATSSILSMRQGDGLMSVLVLTEHNDMKRNVITLYTVNNDVVTKKSAFVVHDSIMPLQCTPLMSGDDEISCFVGTYTLQRERKIMKFLKKRLSEGVFVYNVNKNQLSLYPIQQVNNEQYLLYDDVGKAGIVLNAGAEKTVFYLSADMLVPNYRTVEDIDYDYFGRGYNTQRIVLDGFRTIQNICYVIDETGTITDVFRDDVEGVISTFPMKRSAILPLNGGLLSAQFANDHILYALHRMGEKKSQSGKFFVDNLWKKDKIIYERDCKLEHWYNNYVMIYGYQTIKNNTLLKRSRRFVFFVQKVGLI